MARKEEADETEDQDDEAAEQPAAPDKKKKMMMLGGVIAALLLVSGGGTFALLHFLGDDKPAAEQVAGGEAEAGEGEEHSAEVAKPDKEEALYLQLEPAFLANYLVKGRQHYLQLAIAVMAREKDTLDAMHAHMPLIRNRLVMLLSGETFEQLQTDQGRLQLQEKIQAAIQEILQKETGKGGIEKVLFTNFVMT